MRRPLPGLLAALLHAVIATGSTWAADDDNGDTKKK